MSNKNESLFWNYWYQRLNDFRPLSHKQKLALIPWDDLDQRILPIVRKCNDMKLYTKGCCQGADCETLTDFFQYVDEHPNEPAYYPNGEEAEWIEWPNGTHHSQYAYISFEEKPPTDLLDIIVTESEKLRLGNWGNKVESTKMKFNQEFHEELDRMLNLWLNS